ncbi:MAG: HAMP domain-containing histidine kinase [Flammeovirgaceae bacterium]|jgi:signal transduction histidine kinase|nr:HAMP domain-containing histidine kinase [Flammeovirgaceae bacterium]
MKKAIRNLIIGKGVYIESRNEFRQIMLSGQYALISIVVILFYLITDLRDWPSTSQTSSVYIVTLLLVATSLFLHRMKRHCTANYFLFPTFNIALFLLVSSEDLTTGAFVFFIPASLGSFAVFNYRQRKTAIAFALFSFSLFVLAMVGNFSLLTFRTYSESYIRMNQLINFSLAFPISIMAVYLLISLNHDNANNLLKSNKQLEKLNQELDRFVYSTSHDLRAPLLSVQGLLKLMEVSSNEERSKYQQMIQSRLVSLDKFIHDITDYSRNNRLEIARENVNLSMLALDIWESLKYSVDAQGIEFINELPTDLIVNNDGSRLRIVFSNLIANAIRYHDQRKENRYIRIYHHLTSTSFSLHIQDNGQGIAPEYQTKIFDMFFRGNESSQGSGLGLYIVKETLEKLSGNIQLTSTLRQGSTFSVSIPQ